MLGTRKLKSRIRELEQELRERTAEVLEAQRNFASAKTENETLLKCLNGKRVLDERYCDSCKHLILLTRTEYTLHYFTPCPTPMPEETPLRLCALECGCKDFTEKNAKPSEDK